MWAITVRSLSQSAAGLVFGFWVTVGQPNLTFKLHFSSLWAQPKTKKCRRSESYDCGGNHLCCRYPFILKQAHEEDREGAEGRSNVVYKPWPNPPNACWKAFA